MAASTPSPTDPLLLFTTLGPNGKRRPLAFFVTHGTHRQEIRELIENHGGKVTTNSKEAFLCLVDPDGPPSSDPNSYSCEFIRDSVESGILVRKEPYRQCLGQLPLANRTTQRNEYSREDKEQLMQHILNNPNALGGNEVYKILAAKNPRHPWQSWRQRAIDHAIPEAVKKGLLRLKEAGGRKKYERVDPDANRDNEEAAGNRRPGGSHTPAVPSTPRISARGGRGRGRGGAGAGRSDQRLVPSNGNTDRHQFSETQPEQARAGVKRIRDVEVIHGEPSSSQDHADSPAKRPKFSEREALLVSAFVMANSNAIWKDQAFEEFAAKQQTDRTAADWANYARNVVIPELQRAGFLAAPSNGVALDEDLVGKENTPPDKFGSIEDRDSPAPRSPSLVPPDSPVVQDERSVIDAYAAVDGVVEESDDEGDALSRLLPRMQAVLPKRFDERNGDSEGDPYRPENEELIAQSSNSHDEVLCPTTADATEFDQRGRMGRDILSSVFVEDVEGPIPRRFTALAEYGASSTQQNSQHSSSGWTDIGEAKIDSQEQVILTDLRQRQRAKTEEAAQNRLEGNFLRAFSVPIGPRDDMDIDGNEKWMDPIKLNEPDIPPVTHAPDVDPEQPIAEPSDDVMEGDSRHAGDIDMTEESSENIKMGHGTAEPSQPPILPTAQTVLDDDDGILEIVEDLQSSPLRSAVLTSVNTQAELFSSQSVPRVQKPIHSEDVVVPLDNEDDMSSDGEFMKAGIDPYKGLDIQEESSVELVETQSVPSRQNRKEKEAVQDQSPPKDKSSASQNVTRESIRSGRSSRRKTREEEEVEVAATIQENELKALMKTFAGTYKDTVVTAVHNAVMMCMGDFQLANRLLSFDMEVDLLSSADRRLCFTQEEDQIILGGDVQALRKLKKEKGRRVVQDRATFLAVWGETAEG
ncbi:hypothetical protein BJ742DRAFT_844005 [Cladochytrium replicatum]|nr:hypothetical protein BJ742DRAFT_844005 [Cladochytrium replicatum]